MFTIFSSKVYTLLVEEYKKECFQMSELYNELENKINSTNTAKLTDVEEDLVQAKNDEDISEEEFERLMSIVKHRLGGLNL